MTVNDDKGEFYWKGLFLERYALSFALQADGNPEAASSDSRSRHCAVDRLSGRQDVTERSSEFAFVSGDVGNWERQCKYQRCGD
jgi:hypothetical protein